MVHGTVWELVSLIGIITAFTNYYGTYYGVEGGILDWNYSGALRYGASLYYVRNGVFDSGFGGEAGCCSGQNI